MLHLSPGIQARAALPPPVPSTAPPVSPVPTVTSVQFRNSGCVKKSNDDYMIPSEILSGVGTGENPYMNVRHKKKTVKRSKSFEAEPFYLEMSKDANQQPSRTARWPKRSCYRGLNSSWARTVDWKERASEREQWIKQEVQVKHTKLLHENYRSNVTFGEHWLR